MTFAPAAAQAALSGRSSYRVLPAKVLIKLNLANKSGDGAGLRPPHQEGSAGPHGATAVAMDGGGPRDSRRASGNRASAVAVSRRRSSRPMPWWRR